MCDFPKKSNRIDCSNQPCNDCFPCCDNCCCDNHGCCEKEHCHRDYEEECREERSDNDRRECREERSNNGRRECREERGSDDCDCEDRHCKKSSAILYASCADIAPNKPIAWSSINKVGKSINWSDKAPTIVKLAANKRYFVTFNATLQRKGGGAAAHISISDDAAELFKFFGANGEMPDTRPETYSGSTLLSADNAIAKLNLFLSAAATAVKVHSMQLIIEEL